MDIEYWFRNIVNLSALSIAVPLLVVSLTYKKHSEVARILFYFIIVSTFVEAFAWYTSEKGIENIGFIAIWVLIETAFLCLVFHRVLQGLWKTIVKATFVIILILSILTLLLWSESDAFSSILRSVESGLFIMLGLAYYYQLFDGTRVTNLAQEPMFWFTTAFFLYFAGTLFFFISMGAFSSPTISKEDQSILMRIFIIYSLMLIMRNILIAFGFWRIPEKWK